MILMTALLILGALVSIWTYDWRPVVSALAVVLAVSFLAMILDAKRKRN